MISPSIQQYIYIVNEGHTAYFPRRVRADLDKFTVEY